MNPFACKQDWKRHLEFVVEAGACQSATRGKSLWNEGRSQIRGWSGCCHGDAGGSLRCVGFLFSSLPLESPRRRAEVQTLDPQVPVRYEW